MPLWQMVAGFFLAEGLLVWNCVSSTAPVIQAALSNRSRFILAEHNLDLGAGLIVDGRDVWLTGQVQSSELKALAEESVAQISGVRTVHSLLVVESPSVATEPEPVEPELTASDVQALVDDLVGQSAVEFEPGSERLTASGQALVDELATLLARYPNAKVEIAGHTDSNGTAESNLDISLARAESVRDRLVAGSIAGERLNAVGHGEQRPIADNASAEGRRVNRRVEFVVQ